MEALNNCLAGIIQNLTNLVEEYTRNGTKPPAEVLNSLEAFHRAVNENTYITNANTSGSYDLRDKIDGGKRTRKARKQRRKH